MGVASVVGLLAPAFDEGSHVAALSGVAVGAGFLAIVRQGLGRRLPEPRSAGTRTALLVFVVLTVHSLPEGFAIGTAWASGTAGLAPFVIAAIAIQNIPEGTSVAIPMELAGIGRARQFWAAVGSSAPQPLGALVAFLLVEEVESLLPASFGFAAGAMLALVVVELAPAALTGRGWRLGLPGALVGVGAMLALSAGLG